MNWQDCQVLDFDSGLDSSTRSSMEAAETINSQLLLDWIIDNAYFKCEVFEDSLETSGQKFSRFSISAIDLEGNEYNGFGRSKHRLLAASIAAGEVIERYIVRNVFRSATPIFAKHNVKVSEGEIAISPSETLVALPSAGFHSSNGWAVHFSSKTAIEKSVIESLERHTLLFSYLKNGWGGFFADEQVLFKGHRLAPYVSRFSFGGFSAGIVATEGTEFPGRTFGYLCDEVNAINSSSKWLNAFFESFGQWESLAANSDMLREANFVEKYQKHFLTRPHPVQALNSSQQKIKNVSDIEASILILDLKKALNLPVPLFAAFSFGGNLIPLFFKQKLSAEERRSIQKNLENWSLPTELPEVHPIL